MTSPKALDGTAFGMHYSCVKESVGVPLTFQLLGTLQSVEDRLEEALEPAGLSIAKYGALTKLVAEGGSLPLGTLAERCACVRSNITQLVDRLEADGLVTRNDDPRDRRSVRAQITAEGRSRQEAGQTALRRAENLIFERLTDEDLGQLSRLLERLGACR
jgi:DNA-binding MarR family transcriptional regulator